MKTFQKIALVSAIAAAPFAAQADLTPMDDSLMGNTTGQSGVTIEIELGSTGIQIGGITYTDTAHEVTDINGVAPGDAGYVSTTEDGGSVVLENINISGLGTLTQTIDVSENGDLVMATTAPTSDIVISMGGTDTSSALRLQGTGGSAEIINNLDMTVALGASNTTIKNLSNVNASGLGTLGQAGVLDTDDNTYSTAVGSMVIDSTASFELKELNVGLFGYTNDQAAFLKAGGATQTQSEIANGSAIQITGLSLANHDAAAGTGGGALTLNQKIWANSGGVYIQIGGINADLNINDIAIGGASIGAVSVEGLQMAGLTQRIYGH